MKLKTLRPVAAALALASLAPAAFADTLADHPAAQVARTWAIRGIDPNTFIVGHPAGLYVPALTTAVPVGKTSRSTTASIPKDAQAQAAGLLSRARVLGTSTENETRSHVSALTMTK
jgi:hypothetical protein